jgi:hypothetical protein
MSDAETSFRPAAQMFHRIFAAWDGLHHAVLTGELSFPHVYGQPLFDYIGSNPELAPIFDAGMTAFPGHETDAMLDAYDFSDIKVLADIGGGNGSLLGAVLLRYPHLRGILFDLGHVAGRARVAMQTLGLQERCSVVEGNFFESIPLVRPIMDDVAHQVGVGSFRERCVRSEARIRATRRHQISRVGIGSSHDHWRADVCYVGSNAGGYSHAASIFSNRFRAISITSTLSSAHSHSALMGTHRDCPTSVRP